MSGGVPTLHYLSATSHVAREGNEVKIDHLAPQEADSVSTTGACSAQPHVGSQSLPPIRCHSAESAVGAGHSAINFIHETKSQHGSLLARMMASSHDHVGT